MTILNNNFTKLAATLLIVASCTSAYAADEYNTSNGMTLAGAPLGLHGDDPVAFINIGNRAQGTATDTEVHDGVTYYFSSKLNAEEFKNNPEKYTPQNGGFCTFGVSVGKKFNGDPKFAAIVDDKLYVFINEQILNAFQKDKLDTIAKAEANWKKIQHKAAASL